MPSKSFEAPQAFSISRLLLKSRPCFLGRWWCSAFGVNGELGPPSPWALSSNIADVTSTYSDSSSWRVAGIAFAGQFGGSHRTKGCRNSLPLFSLSCTIHLRASLAPFYFILFPETKEQKSRGRPSLLAWRGSKYSDEAVLRRRGAQSCRDGRMDLAEAWRAVLTAGWVVLICYCAALQKDVLQRQMLVLFWWNVYSRYKK
jgi:hypothetical protein